VTRFAGVIGAPIAGRAPRGRGEADPATAAILARAVTDARACGVTRLADVTRLDALGVHVFQAVRPLGKTVAVHQGKGLAAPEAMIGALMEAVECDHAERFEGETLLSAFAALPKRERPETLGDFAADRAHPPGEDEPLRWVESRRIVDGRRLWIPFEGVSLDLGRPGHLRLERSSVGLAARYDFEGAVLKGLQEVIERDAEQAWMALPIEHRTCDRLEAGTVPYPWFRDLRARIAQAGLKLAVYQLPAAVVVPVILTELFEPGAAGCLRRRAFGLACRATPEGALMASLTEAAQARLTAISGVRDDILYEPAPRPEADGFGVGLPPPAQIMPRPWGQVEACAAASPGATSADLARALARSGFPDAAVTNLSSAASGAIVVKVTAPGLGAFRRTRRPGRCA
jgi:ribosomal protein S12 methylthiotransferase accessory factor